MACASGPRGGRGSEENLKSKWIEFNRLEKKESQRWVQVAALVCPRAAATEDHSLQQQKCIVSGVWGAKVQDEHVAGLFLSEGCEQDSVPYPSSSFWWFSGNLWCYLACKSITAFIFAWHSLCVCARAHANFCFLTRTPVMLDKGPNLLQNALILTNCISYDPIPKKRSHSEVLGARTSTQEFWRWHSSAQTVAINWKDSLSVGGAGGKISKLMDVLSLRCTSDTWMDTSGSQINGSEIPGRCLGWR